MRLSCAEAYSLPFSEWGRNDAGEKQTCLCSPLAQAAQLSWRENRPPGNSWEACPDLRSTSSEARMWRGTQAGRSSHRSA